MSFAELGLSDPLIRVVTELGYNTPTDIQKAAIPTILAGHDLLASAQTGTGKTAGFTLPLLHQLSTRKVNHGEKKPYPPIRALVLAPTRELAVQVQESVQAYSKYTKLTSLAVYGGVNIRPQMARLKRRVDVLVATPGRLLDHVQQRSVDLSHIEILVLDEADRMLDMGFIHDIRRIMALLPAKRQNLLFSATFSDSIKALADGLLTHPQVIEVARHNTTAQTVKQTIYPVDRDRKRELLTHLIHTQKWGQALVFTRTKHGANRLTEQLEGDGIRTTAIHGDKSQAARMQALARFKKGQVRILVATDVAARGIDIDELPYVVNYDLPMVSEDYVHRIGRTGRAGAKGEAISLVCVDEHRLLRDIERLIKTSLAKEIIDGFEPNPNIRPEPIRKGRPGGNGNNTSQPRRSYSNQPSNGRRAPAARTSSGSPFENSRRAAPADGRRTDTNRSAARHQESYSARPTHSYGQFSDQVAAGDRGNRAAPAGRARTGDAPAPRAYGKKASPGQPHGKPTGKQNRSSGNRASESRRNSDRVY
jgi:ATP-dependent RNA helicase RhlE